MSKTRDDEIDRRSFVTGALGDAAGPLTVIGRIHGGWVPEEQLPQRG